MCTLAVVALSACGQEAQEQLQYVSLSQAGCTFFGTDNEPLAVTVETSPAQWAAEASASWVKAEPGEDGTTLVLSVEDNDGDAERKAAVTVTAGQASQTITVYQLAPDLSINRFRKERMFQNGGVVSPSGKYIGGFTNKAMEDNTWEYYPVIIDTETGEKIKLGPFPSALSNVVSRLPLPITASFLSPTMRTVVRSFSTSTATTCSPVFRRVVRTGAT